MPRHEPVDHLAWRTTEVDGRRVNYGVAGHGVPVLFIHGWALGSHAYKRALKRLVRMGCRVYAPALPGFGGTADLPGGKRGLAGYAAWADGFLEAVEVDEPVLAIGHSFGGAVAAKLAHDYSDRVGYLVLVNAVGSGIWSQAGEGARAMSDRPLWHWAVNFPLDILGERAAVPVLSAVLEDAVPNFVKNPLGVLKAAGVARRADITQDLCEIRASGVPVLVLWGEGDTIVPRACFDALCDATGSPGALVPGRHSWLLADPDAFAEVMAGSVSVAAAARKARAALAGNQYRGVTAPNGLVPLYRPEFGRAANE